MKVRLTIMTENDKPCPKAWQTIFDFLMLTSSDPSEKAIVEKAEIIGG